MSSTQARCTESLKGEAFYSATGNDYRGEFVALDAAWAGEGICLSRVAYAREEREEVHLRACAFLDACAHATLWWQDHRRRPFFAAGVEAYHVNSTDRGSNRVLWSTLTAPGGDELGGYRVFNGRGDCLVHAQGGASGYFEVGWLEERRTRRFAYALEWERSPRAVPPPQAQAAPAAAALPVVLLSTTVASSTVGSGALASSSSSSGLFVRRPQRPHLAHEIESLGSALRLVLRASQRAQRPRGAADAHRDAHAAAELRVAPSVGGLWVLTRRVHAVLQGC